MKNIDWDNVMAASGWGAFIVIMLYIVCHQ
jgi:hypothetical protein